MTLQELEQALAQAKKDLEAHLTKQRNPHECSHTWMDELDRRNKAVLAGERALAQARGEEYAVPLPDGIYLRFDRLPRLFLKDKECVTFLAAVAYVPPDWKGKIVGERDWGYEDDSPVLRMEYRHAQVRSTKAGPIESHRLYGRGLVARDMLKVVHPGRTGSTEHHLMVFDQYWIEIEGTPGRPEIWAVGLDEVARHSAGDEIQPG